MHVIFSEQTFTYFFFEFAFVIPKGMLTHNVDPQKGGEAIFTSCMKGLSSLCTTTYLICPSDFL